MSNWHDLVLGGIDDIELAVLQLNTSLSSSSSTSTTTTTTRFFHLSSSSVNRVATPIGASHKIKSWYAYNHGAAPIHLQLHSVSSDSIVADSLALLNLYLPENSSAVLGDDCFTPQGVSLIASGSANTIVVGVSSVFAVYQGTFAPIQVQICYS